MSDLKKDARKRALENIKKLNSKYPEDHLSGIVDEMEAEDDAKVLPVEGDFEEKKRRATINTLKEIKKTGRLPASEVDKTIKEDLAPKKKKKINARAMMKNYKHFKNRM